MTKTFAFTPALFTKDAAAFYLGMSEREVDDLRKVGELIPVGDGKRIKFRRAELDRYAESLPERDS